MSELQATPGSRQDLCPPAAHPPPPAPQKASRLYPVHTGDPSRKVGLHLWEQPSEMGMPARDASRLQSCSHKSRDNPFLLQGNCAGMSSLGEAALGSLGPPGLALVPGLSRHRSSCPRPRWPRGSFPALAMGLWVLTQRRPEEHRVQGLELQLLPVAAVGHFEHCPHHGGVVHCQPAQQGKNTSCGHIHQHQERTRD